jgi:hypothetical protein
MTSNRDRIRSLVDDRIRSLAGDRSRSLVDDRIRSMAEDLIKLLAGDLIRPTSRVNMADLFGELMPQIYKVFREA